MASGRNKKRINLNADRLSNLPDDIIHKILSSVGTKAVVRTSSLSSRWRFLWTSMPYLSFSRRAYPSKKKFCESVLNVLRSRNNQIEVASLYLQIHSSPRDAFFNRVLNYAFSHNVQELTIRCNRKFHPFDFSCSESLKVLTLSGIEFDYYDSSTLNWELPALTTLHLIGVTLYDDEELDEDAQESWEEFFSKCPNLKYLTLDNCTIGGGGFCKKFHLFYFSSESLKVLTLSGIGFDYYDTSTSNWELPTLTTLHLIGVTLYDDEVLVENAQQSWNEFFSKCPNLKYLTLDNCTIGGGGFCIRHPQLSNLKLANGDWEYNGIFVDTPQLKNLSIIDCDFVYVYSAPELTSLIFRHLNGFEFDADAKSFPSLEKVDLCICNPQGVCGDLEVGNIREMVRVLHKFKSVKFLTINVQIPELLSSEGEIASDEPSPFANLKSMMIYPAITDEDEDEEEYEEEEDEDEEEDDDEDEDDEEDEDEEEDIDDEVKNYFLSSPSATVTKVTRQEIKAVTTPDLVINLIEQLQVLLKEEKAKIIMAHKKRGKAPMQSHVTELHQQGKREVMKKMQLLTEDRVLSVESRWKDPSFQKYLKNGKIGDMVSKLQAIKGVLATLPTSKRGDMKAFRRLFAEANLVMKKLDDASSCNIGEEHVDEQLPHNQKEFETTPRRWGNQYKRRSKQQVLGRWGNWYKRRSK